MTSVAVGVPPSTVGKVDAFRSESEFAGPVREWLVQQEDVVGVGDEVDAGSGIADLVAGCSTAEAMPIRPAFGHELSTYVLDLTRHPVSERELRGWAPHGWRSLSQRVVDPLVQAGQLIVTETADDVFYTAAVDAADPFSSLIAVELKLKDWRRAVAQAGRYRLFAECAFVALPEGRVTSTLLVEARRNQVGVLAVTDELHVRMVQSAPSARPLQPSRRRWAAERLLHAIGHLGQRTAGSPIC